MPVINQLAIDLTIAGGASTMKSVFVIMTVDNDVMKLKLPSTASLAITVVTSSPLLLNDTNTILKMLTEVMVVQRNWHADL